MTYHIGASAARDGRRFKRASTLINIFNLFNEIGANIEEIILKAIRKAVIYDTEVSKQNLYEELFLFRGVISKNIYDEKTLLKRKANFLRKCDEKIFSLQVIAEILGSSKSTMSKLLKEKDD